MAGGTTRNKITKRDIANRNDAGNPRPGEEIGAETVSKGITRFTDVKRNLDTPIETSSDYINFVPIVYHLPGLLSLSLFIVISAIWLNGS